MTIPYIRSWWTLAHVVILLKSLRTSTSRLKFAWKKPRFEAPRWVWDAQFLLCVLCGSSKMPRVICNRLHDGSKMKYFRFFGLLDWGNLPKMTSSLQLHDLFHHKWVRLHESMQRGPRSWHYRYFQCITSGPRVSLYWNDGEAAIPKRLSLWYAERLLFWETMINASNILSGGFWYFIHMNCTTHDVNVTNRFVPTVGKQW